MPSTWSIFSPDLVVVEAVRAAGEREIVGSCTSIGGQAAPSSFGATAVGRRGTWSPGAGAASSRFRTITQRTYSSTGVPSWLMPRVRT